METIKHLEKVKDFILEHKEDFDKETISKFGSGALLLASGLVANKLVRGIAIGAVTFAATKLLYDYLKKEDVAEPELA